MLIRSLGLVDYAIAYQAMQDFTAERQSQMPDELWLCEHPPVYTQGLAGRAEHILNAGDIPIVQSNRGGQVTYHGPGQVVAYPLMDLRRAGYYVKEYVFRMEEAVLRTLLHLGVTGHRITGAPGIYVRLDDPFGHAALKVDLNRPYPWQGIGKIAALGVKVAQKGAYHGVALNVAMDLAPFQRINPCGYAGLSTVDLSTMGVCLGWSEAADILSQKLANHLTP